VAGFRKEWRFKSSPAHQIEISRFGREIASRLRRSAVARPVERNGRDATRIALDINLCYDIA